MRTFAAGKLLVPGALVATLALAGCATTFNVRASRAFANEEPDPDVTRDRVDDDEKVLALVDELLLGVPYSPGDPWTSAIALKRDEADELEKKALAAQPYARRDYEVPIVKMYRGHLEEVLRVAKTPRSQPARYPSLLAAVATLSPGAAKLPDEWRALRAAKTPAQVLEAERAIASSASALFAGSHAGDDERVAKDGLDALTTALRVDLEILAVAGYVEHQGARIALADKSFASVVMRGNDAKALAEREQQALERLTLTLSVPANTPVDKAAGFELRSSFVDQVVGIQLDSTRLHVQGDGELLFFHELASPNASGAENDYRGRTKRLTYDVSPVAMVGARASASYDWLHVKNAASLNGSFTTDRLWSNNGAIESYGSLGKILGLRGLVSDFFDMGVGMIGVRTNLRLATFTSGTVHVIGVDPTTDVDQGELDHAPFQLTYTQLDVAYDMTIPFPELPERYSTEELVLGFRYMDYRLPRVFYELELKDPNAPEALYSFLRESPPQSAESRFYMGGLSARFGQGEWQAISFFGDLGVYAGGGPINFYFLRDPKAADTIDNRLPQQATMLSLNASAGLGVRFRLTPRASRLRVITEVQYHAEAVGQGIVSEVRETQSNGETTYSVGKKIDTGGFDLFHGPRLRLLIAL